MMMTRPRLRMTRTISIQRRRKPKGPANQSARKDRTLLSTMKMRMEVETGPRWKMKTRIQTKMIKQRMMLLIPMELSNLISW